MADKKDHKDHKDLKEYLEDESTQANDAIQDEFYDDGDKPKETSSPVPFVANNTAPLTSEDEHKKK